MTRAPSGQRRSVLLSAALVLLLATQGSTPAHADPGVALDQLRPRPSADDAFSASRLEIPAHLALETQLTLDYANDPLVYESAVGASGSERVALVSDQLRGNLALALGLLDIGLLYASLPIDVVSQGEVLGNAPTATGFGVGDLVLGARAAFFRHELGAMGVELETSLPIGKENAGTPAVAGDRSVTFTPRFVAELLLPFLRVTTNVGVRFRKNVELPSAVFGDELAYSLALSMPLVTNLLDAHAEAFGVTPVTDVGTRASSPLEGLLGLKLHAGDDWTFGLASGMGLTRGYGAPDLRVVALANFRILRGEGVPDDDEQVTHYVEEAPPVDTRPVQPVAPPPSAAVVTAIDSDGDQLPDAEDQCPVLAGAIDLGGCPQTFQVTPENGLFTWNPPIAWRNRTIEVLAEGRPSLEELGRVLAKNPALRVVVELHVKPRGDAAELMELTRQRAESIVAIVVDNGAKREQVDAYGCGGTRPIAPLHGHRSLQNERLEVYLVQPLSAAGMPSTLGCEPLQQPAPPPPPPAAAPGDTPVKGEVIRELGSVIRQCAPGRACPGPTSGVRRTLRLGVSAS